MIRLVNSDPSVELALGRKAHVPILTPDTLQGERVLITGGLGSLGLATADALDELGVENITADIDEIDVTDLTQVRSAFEILKPTIVMHLAGAKHAPEGELDPMECVDVNTIGTRNVLAAAHWVDARVVTASTCKACDPETAYGASKLVAERLTLNAGQTVARFHNVVETSGNVFELWRMLDDDESLPVAMCERFLISKAEAVGLIVFAASAGPGRFIVNPGERQLMPSVASRLYPRRSQQLIPPRRGDRLREPLHAACEAIEPVAGTNAYQRVVSPYDAAVAS